MCVHVRVACVCVCMHVWVCACMCMCAVAGGGQAGGSSMCWYLCACVCKCMRVCACAAVGGQNVGDGVRACACSSACGGACFSPPTASQRSCCSTLRHCLVGFWPDPSLGAPSCQLRAPLLEPSNEFLRLMASQSTCVPRPLVHHTQFLPLEVTCPVHQGDRGGGSPESGVGSGGTTVGQH